MHSVSSEDVLVCLSDETGCDVFPFFGHIDDYGDVEWSAGLSFLSLDDVEEKRVFSCFHQDMNALVLACNKGVYVEIYQLFPDESGVDRWQRFTLT